MFLLILSDYLNRISKNQQKSLETAISTIVKEKLFNRHVVKRARKPLFKTLVVGEGEIREWRDAG